MSKPPDTKRYCLNCKEITIYTYDRMIGHSFCKKCGRSSLFAKFKKPEEKKCNHIPRIEGKSIYCIKCLKKVGKIVEEK